AHAAASELAGNFVVRNGLPKHFCNRPWWESYWPSSLLSTTTRLWFPFGQGLTTIWLERLAGSFQDQHRAVVLGLMIAAERLDGRQYLAHRVRSAHLLLYLGHSELRSFCIFGFGDSIGDHAHPRAGRQLLLDEM